MGDAVLVKLGGSLITDKRRPDAARSAVIERLAAEVAGVRDRLQDALILGHGSGSFGHVAAARHGLQDGLTRRDQLPGIGRTQRRAAALDRIVVDALQAAGVPTFTVAPSSAMVGEGGEPGLACFEPVALALERGLVPVVYGDIVMDRQRGVSIFSTEIVFESLARSLPELGWTVRRALWLGETDGILDGGGATIPEVGDDASGLLRHAGEAVGTDVTGGMAHRASTALRLARLGVTSWIGDGTRPGGLHAALEGRPQGGTLVRAGHDRGDRAGAGRAGRDP